MTAALTWLLRVFPAAFRRRFEADMAEQIREDYTRARERGMFAAIAFVLGTAFDLARAGIVERLNPTLADEPDPRRGREPFLQGAMKDLRLAVRALKRSPGFATVAVITLGLAIGANAAIFSVVNGVLLQPLPFPQAERLVYIGAVAPGSDMPDEFDTSSEFYLQYRESRLLQGVAQYDDFTASFRVGDRTERLRMAASTPDLFATLGASPIIGRLPNDEDEDRVALLSHGLWTSWLGADSAVLGRSYYVAGQMRTVIGVMGPEFRFATDQVLLWIPYVVRAEGLVPGQFGTALIARMAPGVTHEALAEGLDDLARRLPERFGGSATYARLIEKHHAIVTPLTEYLFGRVSAPLWMLFGSVGIVLLIACGNVANLFMVRAERRQRDLAVRRAIGAGRGQLFQSQMAEVFVVAVLAGLFAMVMASLGVPAFVRAAPPETPRLGDVHVGVATLAFTFALALVSALLCGLGPALRSSEPSLDRLRDGSRGSTQRRHWARDGLVIAQTALALVLMIGSALLVRSLQKLRHVDPGYHLENIFTFQIAPEGEHLKDAPSFARFHLDFMTKLAALPGVQSVGIVENVPLNEDLGDARFRTEAQSGDPDAGTMLGFTSAAGNYFGTMGIELLAGRTFTEADHSTELGNVIVSRSTASLLWPGQDPIGQRLQREDLKTWDRVVGVVNDVLQDDLRDEPAAAVYYPLVGAPPAEWVISSPAYVVKSPRAEHIAPEIRALVREVAPGAPMYRVFTMARLASDSMINLSFTTLTLGIISALALLLGTVGQYGVLSYVVAERTREIGVRMALGAEAKRVLGMVVAQGGRVVLAGIAIGILAAVAATRAIRGLLFGVEALDLATFAIMAGTMGLVGLLASYVPARRASKVDPIESLRGE